MTAIGPQSPNYATTRPATDPNVSGTGIDTWFKDCSAAGAADGTVITASAMNVFVAQLRNAIRGAGVVLDDSNDDMLYEAITTSITTAIGNLTASSGITRTGDDFTLDLGQGSLPVLTSANLSPLTDLAIVFDTSGNVVAEATIYQIVKAALGSATGVTFNDATGSITFNTPSHTAASTPPASPNVSDTWYDTDTDELFMRTNDGIADIWVQIN